VNEQGHYRSFRRPVFAVSHLHWYSGQETERVYSYNPGARTGQLNTDN